MKLQVGENLESLTKPTITREQLKAYAPASGDFNPIHLDEQFAQEAGFPSVIAHGMISMAFLGDFICARFPEDKYRLLRFQSRFRKVTFPGDVVTCEGQIKAIAENGHLTVALSTKNQNGEVTVEGLAELKPLP